MNRHSFAASRRVYFIIPCAAMLLSACTSGRTPATPLPTTAPPSVTPLIIASPTLPQPTQPQPTQTQLPPTDSIPAATSAPTISPTAAPAQTQAASGTYSLMLVRQGENLTVRQAAGDGAAAISSLPYDATGIQVTGSEVAVQDEDWVEIRLPAGGTGWINAAYLTETVPAAQFCNDQQVQTLLDQFSQAMQEKNGQLLASLISPKHGFNLQLYRGGIIANYSAEEAVWVFGSTYQMPWGVHPGSGLEVKGTFSDIVLPKIQDALSHNPTRLCNQLGTGGTTYTPAWPDIYKNINYYSINKPGTPENELDWRTLVVGVEYISGKPYLVSLIHYEWEP